MEIEDFGECCVCFQAYSQHGDHVPRVLGCGHTLCHHCVNRLAQELPRHQLLANNRQQQRFLLRCPECTHATALATPSSLPKNIELLRLLQGLNGSAPPATSAALKVDDDHVCGFFAPEDVLPFPPPTRVHIVSRSSDSKLLVGRILDEQHRNVDVSLLFLGYGKLSRNVRKELGFVMKLASVCHWACRVLGVLHSGTQLYLVNSVSSSSSVTDHLQRCGSDMRSWISVVVNICESLLEVHWQGTALGLFSTELFLLSTQFTPRLLLHWNAALHLRSVMHRLASAAPSQPLEAWRYTSPEMLVALRTSAPHTPDDKADVWSLASFLHHHLFSPNAPHLSFMQALELLDSGHLVQLDDADDASMGPLEEKLHDFLKQCLVPEPQERPSMSQVWHHLKQLQSLDVDTILDCQPSISSISHCFGLQKDSLEEQSLEGPVKYHPVQFDPDTLLLRRTLDGHADCITCLTICGDKLISASFDKSVRVWSLQDGALLCCWDGHHSHRILAVVADENSQMCFSGDYGGSILARRLDEPFQTQPQLSWQVHHDWRFSGVSALALTPDGTLYSGSGDKTIRAWNTQDGSLIASLEGHRALVSALAVSGCLLYSGSWDGCVGIWLCNEHAPLAMVDGGGGAVRSLATTATCLDNINIVVSAQDNGCVQVWRDVECLGPIKVHDGVVSCVAFAGEHVVTGSWDKSLKIWRTSDLLESKKRERTAVKSISCQDAILSMVCTEAGDLYTASAAKISVYR